MTAMTDATAIPAVLAHHPVARSELWAAWHPDPLIVGGLALTLVLYHHGLARLARQGRRAPSRSAVVAFDCGMVALALALASPLDAAAASIFSAHMVQHLVLLAVAAPLLVCGRPGLVLTSALPARPRRLLRRGGARPAVRRAGTALSHPIVAWVLATVTLWAWHHPSLYEAAVNHDLVHAAEHITLLGSAAIVWAVALGRVRRRLAVPAAALVLVATALQGSAFGAALTLARAPLYTVHSAMAPRWGLTPLEDQQLAGALMWVPPGLVYVGVAAALLVRWFNTLDAGPTVTAAGPIARAITGRGNGSGPRPVGGRTLP
jgi:putative membrane protein